MAKLNSYLLSRIGSWGLTTCFCGEACSGVLSAILPPGVLDEQTLTTVSAFSFAGIIVFAIVCANCAASHAQVGFTSGRRFVRTLGVPAAIAAGIFTMASLLALFVGWKSLTTASHSALELPPAELVVGLLCPLVFAKPMMAWITEGRIAVDRVRIAIERREQGHGRASGPVGERRAQKPLAIGAAVVMASTAPMPASGNNAPAVQVATPADVGPIVSPDRVWRWQKVASLAQQGRSAADIIEITGEPSSTVYKWLAEMGAKSAG